jgi:predicted PurR-regulated permease PerM
VQSLRAWEVGWSRAYERLTLPAEVRRRIDHPRLMARGIRLHPLAVILAVLAGFELGGVAGIFLAIPVVAALSVARRHGLEWLGEPPESPRV